MDYLFCMRVIFFSYKYFLKVWVLFSQLKWIYINFKMYQMFYFLFGPDFLYCTLFTVLDCCIALHHPVKIVVFDIFDRDA